MTRKCFEGLFLVLLAFVVFGASGVRAGDITDDNVVAKISSAKTAADHEALAAFYRDKAEAATASVKRHEAMLKSYASEAGKAKVHMERHCDALVQSYKQEAKLYDSLAKEHADMAKSAR